MFGWMAFGVGEGLVCKILARISSRFSSMKTNKGVLVYRYLLQRGGGVEFCFGIPTWREMIPSANKAGCNFLTLP